MFPEYNNIIKLLTDSVKYAFSFPHFEIIRPDKSEPKEIMTLESSLKADKNLKTRLKFK
ncbi:Uncharacterised protein [Mycoplasmopsis arginini]|nr:Uncharacterised protein [Mycoplasmopsis arginini]SGA21304.1 Uncharacterised protein [Mycoplasmopsis arginini]